MRKICGYLLVACLVLCCAAGARAAVDVRQQLDAGAAALASGDDRAAIAAFEAVLEADRTNGRALHGAALAYYHSGNHAKARALFDRAVAANANPQRSAILNAAAFNIETNQPMRAARLVSDWLKAHPTPPDEPMLNALGSALSQVDEDGRRLTVFGTYAKQYMDLNAKLEATRPGQKRWGVQWMPAADVDQRLEARDKANEGATRLQRVIDDLQRRLQQSQRELAQKRDLQRRGWVTLSEVDALRDQVEQLQSNLALRQREREELLQESAPPSFPRTIEMVALDADAAPPSAGGRADAAPQRADAAPQRTDAAPQRTPAPRSNNTGDLGFGDMGFKDDPAGAGAPADPTAPAPAEAPAAPEPAPPQRVKTTVASVAIPVAPNLLLCSADVTADCTDLTLITSDGLPLTANVERTDAQLGLTLLRVKKNLNYIGLGETFAGGAVQCLALVKASVFQPVPETLSGSAGRPANGWTVTLDKHPRLSGAPLLAGGRLVGIVLVKADTAMDHVPAVTAAQIRAFLGGDAPARSPAVQGDPANMVYQVSATREGWQ